MEYCPHCMRPTQGAVCTHCGGELACTNGPGLLPVGAILRGAKPYQIGAVIGRGGFGVTYIAMDLTNGQRVAVKEYFPSQTARRNGSGILEPVTGSWEQYEAGKRSFLKEAQMLASLRGMPSVVQGLEYLENGGTAYLVMEYLDGTPLFRIVERRGRIPAQELMPRLKPLMEDIGKLHARGVVHRDISPDNIMWMRDGTWKLLDFGSARSTLDNRTMTVAVKNGFAPLEQYQTRRQGPCTDVYALAATVYYCLTGLIPPDAPARLLSGKSPVSPISQGAALTPRQEKALMWALELKIEDRPVNMEAFRKALFADSGYGELTKPPADPGTRPQEPQPLLNTILSGITSLPGNVLALCIGAGALAFLLGALALVVLVAGL